MAEPAKKAHKNYTTWSNLERHVLVSYRIGKDVWFTGKNANSNEGWKKIAAELKENLGEEKNPAVCKAQWNALIKKYKSFFKYHSGEGTGEEALLEESKDWEFFKEIHAYASSKDNYHPPLLIDSRDGVLSRQERRRSSPINENATSQSALSLNEDSCSLPSTSRETPKSRNGMQSFEHHIRQRDKKLNKKISSLLCVFGQMVQTDYPHIDASALLLSSGSDSN